MELGCIGLGRMGKNIVFNLLSKGVTVYAYNRSAGPLKEVAARGAIGAPTLQELSSKLNKPRVIWIMVTAGRAVDDVIASLLPHLDKGDILIDGGNSYFKDSVRRSAELARSGIEYMDIGTSGGLSGALHGACLTIGGKPETYKKVEPLLKLIAVDNGYAYMGESGTGHFVKMVHNGIEYALLQSYAEGFEQLRNAPFDLDLREVSRVWNHGSVIRSWLLELAEQVLKKDPRLEKIAAEIGGGETGAWSVQTALETKVPFPMLAQAISARFESKLSESFAKKFVAALRNEFGGHEVKQK